MASIHPPLGTTFFAPPSIDWTLFDGTIDLADWLNSIDPRNDWRTQPGFSTTVNGAWRELTDNPLDTSYVECDLAEVRTNQLVNTVTTDIGLLPTQIGVAPVWPGLANVTLGTPVALASGVTITTPMDGVIVSITGTDPDFEHYYTYDDLRAYRNVGALVFLDDDGHAESFQPIGFVSAVYCPRSMKRAGAVKMKVGHGLTGTVTPWTITGT